MFQLLPFVLGLIGCADPLAADTTAPVESTPANADNTVESDAEHTARWAEVLANPLTRMQLRTADIDLRFELSDGVFAGKVVDIAYQDSEPGPTGIVLPFTLVTWQVERAWKGVQASELVVARFMGGVTASGEILEGSEQPTFALGDRDVIFLDSRFPGVCPLVGGAFGRMRLVDGKVYGNDGQTFQVTDEGLTRLGARDLVELHVLDRGGEIAETGHIGRLGRGPDSSDEGSFFAHFDREFAGRAGSIRPRNADPTEPVWAPEIRSAVPR